MTISALKARPLPDYTKNEEILNSASHLAGALLGIYILITCLRASTTTVSAVGSIIYGVSTILLYTVSGVYHGLSPKRLLTKQVMRNLDHCTIYVLIVGSYSPVIMNVLYPENPAKALAMMAGIWIAAAIGMVFTAIDLEKYSKFSMFCYMALGWFALFIIKPIMNAVGAAGIALLVGGGLSYTVGALIYGLGKRRYMHTVFHLFVILGTLLHYICFITYIIK